MEVWSDRDAAKQEVEALRKYNTGLALQLSRAQKNTAILEVGLASIRDTTNQGGFYPY